MVILRRRGFERLGVEPGGDDRDDFPLLDAECRRALERVELREPPGGAGAHVDEPPALRQPVDDRIDRALDRRRGETDGGGDGEILPVDQIDQLGGRPQVVLGSGAVAQLS